MTGKYRKHQQFSRRTCPRPCPTPEALARPASIGMPLGIGIHVHPVVLDGFIPALPLNLAIYLYIYIYTNICIYIYVYIYVYIRYVYQLNDHEYILIALPTFQTAKSRCFSTGELPRFTLQPEQKTVWRPRTSSREICSDMSESHGRGEDDNELYNGGLNEW